MPGKYPRLIDSHAHLNFLDFNRDREDIIYDSLEAGIWIINVGAGFDTSRKAVELAQKYCQGVYATIGVHPIHVFSEEYSQEAMWDLAKNNENIVAIGEIGLDYFHLKDKKGKLKGHNEKETKEKQKELFFEQLKLARMLQLPVILHCRHNEEYDAHRDILEILEKFTAAYSDFTLKGVMHCYTGDIKLARIYLKLGFYLGFTGVITFSDDYDAIIKETPLDRILVETDCPYLSPEPKRGERNVPQNVKYMVEKIAKVKGEKETIVAKQTVLNASNLFSLKNEQI